MDKKMTKDPAKTGDEIFEDFASVGQVKNMIGAAVEDPTKDKLGKVEDIIMDWEGSRILFVVLAMGGFLGIGDQYLAVPPQILSYNAIENSFLIEADIETLKKSATYSKNDLINICNPQKASMIYEHYGVAAYWIQPGFYQRTGDNRPF